MSTYDRYERITQSSSQMFVNLLVRTSAFVVPVALSVMLCMRLFPPQGAVLRDFSVQGTFHTTDLIVDHNTSSGTINTTGPVGVGTTPTTYDLTTETTSVGATSGGIKVGLDTTVDSAARGGLQICRAAGASCGSFNGGIAMAANSSFPFTGILANDVGVYAEGGRDLYLGADNSTFVPAVKITSADNSVHVLHGPLTVSTDISNAGVIDDSVSINHFHVDPTGVAYFQSATPFFGFGTNAPISPVDISNAQFNVTSTAQIPNMIHGVTSTLTYDTTASVNRAVGVFFDFPPQRVAGSNELTGVTMRLDARNADKNVALWIDEGETWLQNNLMFTVRPSIVGSATVSSCGTGPVADLAGNNDGGRITVGGGAVTSCSLTFNPGWTDHTNAAIVPTCIVNLESGVALPFSPTSGGLTITGTLTGGFIDYRCNGADVNIPQ